MSFYEHIVIANFALTWFMVGLIWLIQIVNYPLFRLISKHRFPHYHESHIKRITPIVSTVMILEASVAVSLILISTPYTSSGLVLINVLFLALIWLSTALLQLPMHNKLNSLKNPKTVNELITSNWFRTSVWSLKGFCGWLLLIQIY